MAKKKGPNKENIRKSRASLMKAATSEFLEYGYADASTNRIVERSKMARGSLYYHFGDKKGLFASLYIENMHQVREQMQKSFRNHNDVWDQFMAGVDCYIDYCRSPEFRKIA